MEEAHYWGWALRFYGLVSFAVLLNVNAVWPRSSLPLVIMFIVVTCWACLFVFSVPTWYPTASRPQRKSTTQEISISYNTDWPIRSGFLLANSHILNNPFFRSLLAIWLSTFFSGAAHILLLWWSGQKWEESSSSSPEFSCSTPIISTSSLVFLPTPPAWPISVYLKHDWQNTDNSPTLLPPLFF